MDAYASHIPLLIRACLLTAGPVLELGMGDNSTPILIELCRKRMLVSMDNDNFWYEKELPLFKDQWIKPILVDPEWNNFYPPFFHYGVVFVDIQPAEMRPKMIQWAVQRSDIVVAHDSQDLKIDWSIFRYHKCETPWLGLPSTAIASNVIDVTT